MPRTPGLAARSERGWTRCSMLVDGRRGRRHEDPGRVVRIPWASSAMEPRHGRGEEECLRVLRQPARTMLRMSWMKPMSSMLVGFVEDEDLDRSSSRVARCEYQVEQASRCRDQHVDAARQRAHLRVMIDAAVATQRSGAGSGRRSGSSRRSARPAPASAQDERAAALARRAVAVAREMLEDRERERGGLAGAGLRMPTRSRPSRRCGMVCA